MPDGLTFTGMGRTVRLDFDDSVDPAVALELAAQWADSTVDDQAEPALRVRVTDTDSVQSSSVADVWVWADPLESLGERTASQITLALLPLLRGQAIMLHAGAIALDDGRVIGFVGPSGRGKTTAMIELGTAHRYVTDETLVIRSDLSVTPYPKPLLVGQKPATKSAHSASSLGLREIAGGDLQLAALVILDRVDDTPVPSVLPVELADSLVLLAEQSSYLAALDHPLADLAQLVRRTGGVRRVRYTEASALPRVLDEILAAPHDDLDFAPCLPDSTVSEDVGAEEDIGADVVYRRVTPTQALYVGDRLVVMHDGDRITVLAGIGPVIWQSADGVTETVLVDAALEAFPELPPDVHPLAAVRATVDELIEAGVLRKVSPGDA